MNTSQKEVKSKKGKFNFWYVPIKQLNGTSDDVQMHDRVPLIWPVELISVHQGVPLSPFRHFLVYAHYKDKHAIRCELKLMVFGTLLHKNYAYDFL